MTSTTQTDILTAYDAEYIARRKHWIGGVPQQCDLRGIRQHVSAKLRVPVESVAEALADRLAALTAEHDSLTAQNAATTSWGAAVGARAERIAGINQTLNHLGYEP